MYLLGHDRREGARNGHARAHGGREVAALEHHHLAAEHVGRDGAVGDRQLVEIRLRARVRDVAAQQVLDVARVDDASRQHDPLVPQAQLDVVAVGHPSALLLDRLQVAPANAADDRLPVDADHELLESCGRDAGRIAAADERAHAGARDAVDGDVHFLEHLEDADVGAALGAAAGQHQADPRSSGWRGRGLIKALLGGL